MNKLRMIIVAVLVTISFGSCLIEAPRGPGRGNGPSYRARGNGGHHGGNHQEHRGRGHGNGHGNRGR